MSPLLIKVLRTIGITQIIQFWQNIFRTRFANDMYIAQVQVVSKTHEKTFAEYKNKHNRQDIAIIATGPSLNNYKPLENVINIGVNKTIFYDKINLDYYFAIDYSGTKNYLRELSKYPSIKKFYGIFPHSKYGSKWSILDSCIIPESIVLEQNAKKYYIYSNKPAHQLPFNTEIDKTWLVDGGSCIFSAMQFALFTNPKRIYLVGCDCTSGYFDEKKGEDCSHMIETWKELKRFADIYYPETEIISVNPVGLKELFTDLYQ